MIRWGSAEKYSRFGDRMPLILLEITVTDYFVSLSGMKFSESLICLGWEGAWYTINSKVCSVQIFRRTKYNSTLNYQLHLQSPSSADKVQ